jgi:hypothetical protein
MDLLMKLLASSKLTMVCVKSQIPLRCLDPNEIKPFQELALPSHSKVAEPY